MFCSLCNPSDERIIWQDRLCRVILVDDPLYPGYCRVIWHDHVSEMTDLEYADRQYLLNVVMATESAVRVLMQPSKINLASFGNKVPHLHWHIVPRFVDDPHFPESVWSAVQRTRITPPVLPHISLFTQKIETELKGFPSFACTEDQKNKINKY